MTARRSRWGDLATLGVVVGLLLAVYLLPPDTALREMRASGVLRACVPTAYPPLVTGAAERPGLEVEMLTTIADRLGVRLVLAPNPAIGRDFNPRAWRLSRANCQIIAGGIAATPTTRNFLDTTPPHLETGWVALAPAPMPQSLEGLSIAFFPGSTGRDRLALSRILREGGARVTPVATAPALTRALADGQYDAAVTDALIGGEIARENGWQTAWLEGDAPDPVAFGLWKGDLTLKREIVAIIEAMIADGEIAALIARYGIADPDLTLGATTETGP